MSIYVDKKDLTEDQIAAWRQVQSRYYDELSALGVTYHMQEYLANVYQTGAFLFIRDYWNTKDINTVNYGLQVATNEFRRKLVSVFNAYGPNCDVTDYRSRYESFISGFCDMAEARHGFSLDREW